MIIPINALYEKIKRCEITMNFKCDLSQSRHRLKLEVVVSEACREDSVSNIKGVTFVFCLRG